MQKIYWLNVCQKDHTKEKLSIYGVSIKSLGEFINTEKDIIRGINNKPGAYFLLNNQKEKDKEVDLDDQDLDFDDFDQFIVIDKEDLQTKLDEKLNANPEKLQKEEEKMKEGDLLIDNTPDSKEDKICLEDFKIVKVLDKGSFGKVF